MGFEFRLLGDVGMVVDGRAVDLGHARQRCVLVALLVDANRVVSAETLLHRVWADSLPVRARHTLSSYLSRLRRILAAAPEVSLARQPGGYRLTVDPQAVDLHRFRHLVSLARAADAAETAAALFADALALWRGEAFATLDTPWLHDVREALCGERLAAELDRNDLALDRGEHATVLGELSARAAAHPLDERLAGQLILALYRCGRQADALRQYDLLRRRLAAELGADPGPPLRKLHQRILTADPAINGAPAPGRAGLPVPRQLPTPPRLFTGRVRELALLDAILDDTRAAPSAVVISAVSGAAGVGKTALAVHWAHRIADRFPDGQLYVNLRGFDPGGSVLSPADAVRGFLDALAVPPGRIPASLDAQAALYRSLLAGKRVLVVLDNARDTGQLRPLLPGTPGNLVLVTSRNQLTGLIAAEAAHPLTLDLLTPADARDLLALRLGADRITAEPDAVDEIISRCTRLPLALAIVAARAATHPSFTLAALASELRETRGLDALAGSEPHTDVRAVFSWSYTTLGPPAARLFGLLGLHPAAEITVPAAASLTALPIDRVRPLLTELTQAHLLTEHAPGRYTLHDLLRAYATELVHANDTEAERHQTVHRILDHYLHTAHTATNLIEPHHGDRIDLPPIQTGVTPDSIAGSTQAMTWFAAEHRTLLTAIEHAAAGGFEAYTWRLAWALTEYGYLQGRWHDLASAYDTALQAARRVPDPHAQAHAHRGLGIANLGLGSYDQAGIHFRQALELYGQTGDQGCRAHAQRNLGVVAARQGRPRDALDHIRLALALYKATGNQTWQIRAFNSIGWCHALLGNYEQTLRYCQRALIPTQRTGDRLGEAATWDSLGYAHHHLGHHQQAIDCYQQALHLYRDLSARYPEAEILTHLAETHHAAGAHHLAQHAWRQALTILTEFDHPDADHIRAKLQNG